MPAAHAIVLGIIQGLTEFLPISSSAHLVAAQRIMGVNAAGILLEVALHFGTLIAIVLILWRSIWHVARDGVLGLWMHIRGHDKAAVKRRAPLVGAALAVLVGTIPAGLLGVLLRGAIEHAFEDVTTAGALLMVTGLMLLASRWAPAPATRQVQPSRGFLIGIAQAAALLPGISRSGFTIVAGYFLGVNRDVAARFSFLLAIPALMGASCVQVTRNWMQITNPASAVTIALGMAASIVTGAGCLILLLGAVRRGRLHYFAAYCLPAGLAMLLYGLLH